MDLGILSMLKVEREIEYQHQVGRQPAEQYRFSLGKPQILAKKTASKENPMQMRQATILRQVEQCK
jgi:hypothetical protein